MQSLVEFIARYAAHGNEAAVRYRRGYRMETWTYARVVQEANRAARELEFRGIGKGDAVVLWGESSPEWITAFFGCLLRGAVAVPIDHGSTAEFAARVAREVNAKLIFRSRAVPDIDFGAAAIVLESLGELTEQRDDSPYPAPALGRGDTLEIIFTSGTTAEPRGVVISHGNVLANIEPLETEIRKYLRYERIFHPLRFLNLLPLSHVFGQMLGIFIPPLLAGTVVLIDTLKPSELINVIRRERVSVLVAVPRFMESLQREIQREMERDGRSGKFNEDFARGEKEHFLRRWWRFRGIHSRFGWKFWAFISGGAALPEQVEGFLEAPGLRGDSRLRHDGDHFTHQPESSLPVGPRLDRKSFSGDGSARGRARRNSGARRKRCAGLSPTRSGAIRGGGRRMVSYRRHCGNGRRGPPVFQGAAEKRDRHAGGDEHISRRSGKSGAPAAGSARLRGDRN